LIVDSRVAAGLSAPGWEPFVTPFGARSLVLQRILEAYTAWRASDLERLLARLHLDVALFPQQSVFPVGVRVPAVVTVGDVQHLYMPENFGLFDRTFRARAYPRSLDAARHVIAISEFTRRALVERCDVPQEKVTVVPHGCELDALEMCSDHAAPAAPIAGPYLYYPAATYAHKGHETLFRTYATLRRRGALEERLVLTGHRTKLWHRELLPLLRQLAIDGDVLHLGFVPHAELRRIYLGASAVLFPSRFEGLGIPVLEAARLGKRLVTSRLEVFDEVGVPRHFQIDFADPESLLRALRDKGPSALEKVPLSWRECAQMTLDVLRRAV
jgi:glycosyltransferase involved in cell wall biosynthesis